MGLEFHYNMKKYPARWIFYDIMMAAKTRRYWNLSILGNILWFVCGGFLSALSWFLAGLLWCVTVVGIPVGVQCFKFARLSCCPFGKDVVWSSGAISFVINVLWIIFFGVPLAIEHLVIGIFMCVTIIGIPFGKQHFKLAKLALMPFGAEVVR